MKGLGVLPFVLAACIASFAGEARADVVFSHLIFDLGEIKAGTPLSHRFPFVNRGPGVVEFTGARASCGCIAPHFNRRVIPPGEEGSLLVEVNTLGQPSGPHAWTVHVSWRENDADQETDLRLSALLVTEVSVQPASLTLFVDRAFSSEILLTDLRPNPLAVVAVQTSSPHLLTSVTGESRDDQGRLVRTIRLDIPESFPEERRQETLVILTNDSSYRELRVPVTIVKRPRQGLTVHPAEVSLSAPAGQPVPSRLLLVRDRDNRDVVIEEVSADHPAVSCRWVERPGTTASVKISVDRERCPTATLQATIQIRVKQPVEHTLSVPVTCRLQ